MKESVRAEQFLYVKHAVQYVSGHAVAGTEIPIFHHAPTSRTSVLHDNFMKNMFLRAIICPFTNDQICKRTNNLPIDK